MRILLVDPVESDRALTTKLLQLKLPDAVCVGIHNHAGLLRELGRGGADLLIAAVDPGGITIEELQAVLAETVSKPAIVVTGEASHLETWCRDAVSRLDGIVAKTSAGYTELSEIVKAIIADRTMTGSLALSEIPVPAFYTRSDGQITRSNHRFDAVWNAAWPRVTGSRSRYLHIQPQRFWTRNPKSQKARSSPCRSTSTLQTRHSLRAVS